MNYLEMLKKAMNYETIEDAKNCCINIATEVIDYSLSFIDCETENHLGVWHTGPDGLERFVIIQKKYIVSVSVVYKNDIDFIKEDLNFYE